jgi:hypothetical protein
MPRKIIIPLRQEELKWPGLILGVIAVLHFQMKSRARKGAKQCVVCLKL